MPEDSSGVSVANEDGIESFVTLITTKNHGDGLAFGRVKIIIAAFPEFFAGFRVEKQRVLVFHFTKRDDFAVGRPLRLESATAFFFGRRQLDQ